MTKTLTQATAAVLAALITTATFAGANGMATQQYAKADAVATAGLPMLAAQTVVIVGRRNA